MQKASPAAAAAPCTLTSNLLRKLFSSETRLENLPAKKDAKTLFLSTKVAINVSQFDYSQLRQIDVHYKKLHNELGENRAREK